MNTDTLSVVAGGTAAFAGGASIVHFQQCRWFPVPAHCLGIARSQQSVLVEWSVRSVGRLVRGISFRGCPVVLVLKGSLDSQSVCPMIARTEIDGVVSVKFPLIFLH